MVPASVPATTPAVAVSAAVNLYRGPGRIVGQSFSFTVWRRSAEEAPATMVHSPDGMA